MAETPVHEQRRLSVDGNAREDTPRQDVSAAQHEPENKGPFAWLDAPNRSRIITADDMHEGDIAMKLRDGHFFLVGTGGQLYRPSPWDRFLHWLDL